MQIEWLDRALDDFDEAMSYIAERNPQAAQDVARQVHRQVAQLRFHPLLGRPGRVEGTRELVIGGTHFVLPYRFDGRDLAEILAVMHDAQEWPGGFAG
jgi:addiction module toxin, RelE/StbE family